MYIERGAPAIYRKGGYPPGCIYREGAPPRYIYRKGGPPRDVYIEGGPPPVYIHGGTVMLVVLEYWGYGGVIH